MENKMSEVRKATFHVKLYIFAPSTVNRQSQITSEKNRKGSQQLTSSPIIKNRLGSNNIKGFMGSRAYRLTAC